MKNINIILPLGIFAAMLLSACDKHESAPRPDNSRHDLENSTRTEAPQESGAETDAIKETERATTTRKKPIPKMVRSKSFSLLSDEPSGYFQSTAPVSAAGYGTSVTIIQNAVPQVQGTAAPAPTPAPEPGWKKPIARPVY